MYIFLLLLLPLLINKKLFNYNFNLYTFLLLPLFILFIYTYCTVVLLYCCIMTNALRTYVDCDWFHICKDLWKVNKYDMVWYVMIWYVYIMSAMLHFSVKYKILFRKECLITIQKNIRMFLVKRIHQPRYRGIIKIKSLQVCCYSCLLTSQ